MPLHPLQHRATVPAGVTLLAATVVATGWLMIQGLPFAVGCLVAVGAALGAIALLIAHPSRR
jgi:hypothetical protein